MIFPLLVLGSASEKRISSGPGEAADFVRDPLAQFFAERVVIPVAFFQRDEAADGLPGNLARLADHRGFRDRVDDAPARIRLPSWLRRWPG